MNHKARLKLIERKVNADETLQAILPSWLYDGYQPAPKQGEKVIKPSGYLALDENGDVYYEQ